MMDYAGFEILGYDGTIDELTSRRTAPGETSGVNLPACAISNGHAAGDLLW